MRVGLLLAAGRSLRFGADDKLLAALDGRPLVDHAAAALASTGMDRLVAVVSNGAIGKRLVSAGYEVIQNSEPEAGLGRSLAVGAGALSASCTQGILLIALGDMPRVTASHFARVLDAPGEVVASRVGDLLQPPARFDLTLLPALSRLDGDRGARDLLAGATAVEADPDELADVDTPDALSRLASPSG